MKYLLATISIYLCFSFKYTTAVTPPEPGCDEAPVCGSDGNSYTNLQEVNCVASCTKNPYLKAVSVGKCENPCVCPMLHAPVCGSNGVTYSNPCVLECAAREDYRIQEADNQPCDDDCISRCSKEYSPVCGSDGITYFNIGILTCVGASKKVKKVSNSECPCMCPKIYKPVCGSDGITYSNECELVCAKRKNYELEQKYEGMCIKPCACSLDLVPVCGSDGRTYTNKCMLECAKINGKPSLHVKYMGDCKKHHETEESESLSDYDSYYD